MSHLDEARLHAFLDGELPIAERTAVEAHLEECPSCQALYAEARAFAAEADALLDTMDLPPKAGAPAPPGPGRFQPRASRWVRYRTLAWAATVVLAAGLGYLASDLRYHRAFAPAETDFAPVSAPARPRPDQRSPADRERPTVPASTQPAPASEAQGPRQETARTLENRTGAKPQATIQTGEAVPETGLPARTANANDAERVASPPAERIATPGQAAPVPGARLQDSLRRPAMAPSPRPSEGAVWGGPPHRGDPLPGTRPGFRPISLEEAVRRLGGNIRLVDGMVPSRILAETGAAADSALGLVRVVYGSPPDPEIWLDQWRSGPLPSADRARAPAFRDEVSPPRENALAPVGAAGVRNLRWQDQAGFSLSLTGNLPLDSLKALARRVH